MVSWLVLGSSTLGRALLSDLSERVDDLVVLDADETRVETLRNDRVAARTADETAPDAIATVEDVDVVLVAGRDPRRNRDAVAAVREVHPGAYVIAHTGQDVDREVRGEITALADRVLDPGEILVEHLESRYGTETRERVAGLRSTLRAVDGSLGVFTHDNPDPDAIASAVALVLLADHVGVEAEACYYGEIAHQENRALVNLLDLDLRRFEDDEVPEYDVLALVDHSAPGVNDGLPADVAVDVVIDHHPTERAIEASYVDLRESVGATSTLLAEYLEHLDIEVPESVATALLYGIRIDTRNFTREITVQDFEAAAYLVERADPTVLEQVESPSVSADTFETIGRAIRNRQIRGMGLATCVGAVANRDALSQAADTLLAMQGVTVTLVSGFSGGTIYVSARSRQPDLDLGAVLRDAFDDIGSAGGHDDMAGAQIPLGLFGEVESEEEGSLSTIVGNVVAERFFETLSDATAG